MNIEKLINDCRLLETDHEPDGWPAIQMKDVIALCDEIERLKGLKPELPPYPTSVFSEKVKASELPRYGLRWNGPSEPVATLMQDGYWTPWHLADSIEQERDQLKVHCESLSTAAAMAVGALPNKSTVADVCVAAIRGYNNTPVKSIEQSLAEHDAEVITKILTNSLVAEALQTEWTEWCEDTGCIPYDFEIQGDDEAQVSFTASAWSESVAEHLRTLCIGDLRQKAQEAK